jgi:Ser/Thr protein kinase RdoA (MazF antagonist)
VTALERLSGDGPSTSLLVTLSAAPRRLVLKVAPRDSPTVDFGRTAAAMSLARGAGLPVATLLAAGPASPDGPWQCLLTEHVAGVEWRRLRPQLDAGEVYEAHRQIAEAVLALQSVRLAGFGELGQLGQPTAHDLLASLRRRALLRVGRAADRELFLGLLEQRAGLFFPAPVPTLCHDDLHHANVVFGRGDRGWRLAAVIDWDKAWVGPAESDVARMSWWDDMTGPGFWEVYRLTAAPVAGDTERTLIYQLLWCLEYGESTPRHREDTARLCRQLGLRRQEEERSPTIESSS